jgi:hypothetical protein
MLSLPFFLIHYVKKLALVTGIDCLW